MLPCEVLMPPSGTGNLQTTCAGTLYDSGGPTSNYGGNQNSQITISPIGATSVSLSIISFAVEAGSSGTNCNYDYVRFYDGPNTASPLIGTYCNNNMPPTTINSTGASITVVFHSDGGLELAGFEIDWNCVFPTTPPVADFVADVTTTCNGAISFTDLSTNGPTGWAWDFGDGNISSAQHPSHNYANNGTYAVQLIATNSFGDDTELKTAYVVVNKPAAPAVTDDAICEGNTATLGTVGSGTLNWYDLPVGGTLLNTGASYTTPVISSTTSYYVEEELPGAIANVGPVTNTFGTGGNFNGDQYQIFTCSTPVILKSVKVYASGAGNRTIELRDNVGTVLQSVVVNIPNGTSVVNLDFDLPVATNLQLGTLAGSSPSLYRNNAGASYPYNLAGQVSITNSSAGGAYYYFFYDWTIEEYSCLSERAQVTAVVTPQEDATITPVSPMCTSDAPANLVAIDAGGTWSGSGVVGSTFDPSIAGGGNHTITYTITGMCGDVDTEVIAVSDAFDATILASGPYCSQDTPTNLSAANAGGVWSGPGITSGSLGTFDPTAAGVGTHAITYFISGTCGDTDTENIVVNQQADATILTPSTICSADAPFNINANEPGGIWNGTGITDVNAGTFDPSVSGVGTFTITYDLGGLCPDSDTEDIIVLQQPNATINTAPSVLCRFEDGILMTSVNAGGSWSADCGACINTTTGLFNPNDAGNGIWTIYYTLGTDCISTDSIVVTVSDCLGFDPATSNKIVLYPNPAHNEVTLLLNSFLTGEFAITDALGRIVLVGTINSNQVNINLENLTSRGTYFIHIQNSEGEIVGIKKLVKN